MISAVQQAFSKQSRYLETEKTKTSIKSACKKELANQLRTAKKEGWIFITTAKRNLRVGGL